MEVRVVCGLSATIAIFAPASAFSSVDLPALGRPSIETKPDRNPGATRVSLMRHGLRSGNAYALHAQLVAGQHFDADAVAHYGFALVRHVPQPLGDQAAHCGGFDFFLRPEFQKVAEAREIEISRDDVTARAILGDV